MYNAYICLQTIPAAETENFLTEANMEELIRNVIVSSNKLNNIQIHFIKERKQIPEKLEITKRRSASALKGKRNGPQDHISLYLDQIKIYLAEDMEIKEISKILNVNYSSLYNYIIKQKLRKQRKIKSSQKCSKKDWSKVKKRKSKLDPYRDLIVEELKNGEMAVDIAKNNGWAHATLTYYIRARELRKEIL